MALSAILTALSKGNGNSPPEAFKCPPPLKKASAILLHGKSSTERSDTRITSLSVSSRREMLNFMPLTCRGMLTNPSASPLMSCYSFISSRVMVKIEAFWFS